MRRRTRWRRECFAPVERPQPHPAASCPGSGEQRRPFGEGPPQDGGCGVPGAGLRPGRAFVRQGGWGCGPQWPRPRPGAGSGPEPRRGRSAFPAGSRSRKGRCLAPRPRPPAMPARSAGPCPGTTRVVAKRQQRGRDRRPFRPPPPPAS